MSLPTIKLRAVGRLTFVIALVVYLITMPPGLTWAHFGNDGGDLITAAVTLGVPHPSGYPTYVLLGKIFSQVPLGSIPYRFNLFSAVCMALSAATLARTVRVYFGLDGVAPVAAALSFAFAPLVWSQAIITEVYALNLAVLSLLLWSLLTERSPILSGFLLGLSSTTHLTSLLFAPLALWLVAPKLWPRLALGAVVGMVPWLALPIFGRGDSPVVWGDTTTLQGWYWTAAGVIYRPNLFSHSIFPRLSEQLWPALRQFSVIGWLLMPLAFLKRPTLVDRPNQERSISLALLLLAAVYALYSLTYDTPDFAVFVLPALLLCAIILANALRWLGVAAIILPLLAVGLNFSQLNLHDDTMVQIQLDDALTVLPQDAIVLTPGDQSIFTLWVAHYVENQRSDIVPVDANLMAFDWYRERLQRIYPTMQGLEVDDLAAFGRINSLTRPVCQLTLTNVDATTCVKRDE